MANLELIQKFQMLGISEQKARETVKNANITKNLQLALETIGSGDNMPEGTGILLYHLATRIKPQISKHIPFIARHIVANKLNSTLRVDVALEYLLKQGSLLDNDINEDELNRVCGVGVIVTPEEIEKAVQLEVSKHKDVLLKERYRYNAFKIMQKIREELKWADAKHIKSALDVEIFDLLGPKTEDDLRIMEKNVKKHKKEEENQNANNDTKDATSKEDNARTITELMKNKVHFHAPGENYKTDGYIVTEQTNQLLKEHLKITGGRVQTRFPPEPNGILHIGHAKAININFGYAAAHNGICYLRYDDTNPEKEEEKFFVGIREMVEWLGYKPYKVTHSSDYFQQLYEWALVLIRKGLAYVCHQRAEEIKGFNPTPSPWRDRLIEESLQLFEDMKNGKIDEGAATLRLKITLEEGKMDPVAYRIKFIPHHRTGNQWCIYPTYDYTHCLCDSIENITHSMCTKEFQSRRSTYYWLCNALNIYCPVQWEYGRLNVNYALVSKRKIGNLISKRIVDDWDDPRLFTLTALRRRGFPPEAINNFCAQMGVTGAQISVDPCMLEACVRDVLNVTAPRRLVVLEPLKITIINFPHETPIEITVPNFPQKIETDSHTVVLDRVIYIERGDFKENPEKGYRRLAPNQTVGLRHAGMIIKLKDIIRNSSTGEILELMCECEIANRAEKPKAFIQWVSKPIVIEIRLYDLLFLHKNPEDPSEVPNGYLTDINPDSKIVLQSFADKSLETAKIYEQFQFERVGFFSVDPDTACKSKLVFNRTVHLKEDSGKK